jgi:hypothetical protein
VYLLHKQAFEWINTRLPTHYTIMHLARSGEYDENTMSENLPQSLGNENMLNF